MSQRVICPACSKTNHVEDVLASQTIICLACGVRISVEPIEVITAEPLPAYGTDSVSQGDAPESTDVGSTDEDSADLSAAVRGMRKTTPRHATPPKRKVPRKPIAGKLAIVGVCAILLAATAGLVFLVASNRGAASESDVRDLLALKSEAEGLAIAGNLEESHAKYRELQAKSLGRTIKDPLFWDFIERAKADQDRIYTLLLDKAQAANPPERAMPTPGMGTSTRADDPWYWPRVGAGGRAEMPADSADPVTQPAVAEVEPSAPATPADTPPAPAPAAPIESAAVPPAPAPTTAPAPPTAVADASSATTAPARTRTPSPWVADNAITDDEIGDALKRGVDFLLAQFKDGALSPIPGMTKTQYAGRNAMAVYALLKAGEAMSDPRLDPKGELMGRMIDVMKSHSLERVGNEPAQPVTYARSIRAAALAIYNRPQDRSTLQEDADWLIAAAVNGAYTYDDTFSGKGMRDIRMNIARPEFTESTWDEALPPQSRWDAPALFEDSLRWDTPAVADEEMNWSDARRIFCDGLHDRNGRELTRLRRPTPQRLGTSKPLMPPQNRTQRPELNGPQRRTQPTEMWRPPREAPLGQLPPRTGGDMNVAFPWDNSNSQYGLLGVWAAAETGIEVPQKYWEAVQKHWETWQLKSGEWGYMATDRTGTLAMTCGGVASLLVTYDWLVAPKSRGQVGRPTMSDNLAAGMKWLETTDNAVNTPIAGKTHYPGYDLFGLERVGLASGYKYLGSHDWYRELAAKSLATQFPSGAWGRDDGHPDGMVETAYHLLFLSHGRHPIFMNKLRFNRSRGERMDGKPLPGYWANRPRDAANLTRFASRELERSFNWQVVDLEREWSDWLDSPVLYIASHTPPAFTDEDYAKLRQYVEAGGIIFAHADAGSPSFTKWVLEELAAKALPSRKVEPLKENHPIYSLHYDLKKPVPPLFGISNGSRLMLLHSPTDLGSAWQQRSDRTQTPLYRLGMHVFLYAAGKSDFRNRIDSPYIPPAPAGESGAVAVARVKYEGNWDPEPGAWRRFANLYQWEMDTSVPVIATDFAALDATNNPVAHLTGTESVEFNEADINAVKSYVEAGGILFIDACGGSPEFNVSVREGLLAKAFPGVAPQTLPAKHPLLTGGVADAEPIDLKLRTYAADKLKMKTPPLELISAGKGSVVISRIDVITGLLGTNTYPIVGYDAPFAQTIMWNLLMWAGNNTGNAPVAQ